MYILYLFFFQPTYNLFNLILYFLPAHTFWIAIFIIVVFVKILLIPLAIKQSKDNVIFQRLQKKVKEITKNIKDVKERNLAVMNLYKAEGVSPFSPLKGIIIQVPIFLSLFFVILFLSEGLDSSILYTQAFDFGEEINRSFFSIIDLDTGKSIYMACVTGLLQLILFRVLMSKNKTLSESVKNILTFAMVIVITIASYNIGAGASFYWCVNIVFSIIQDVFIIRNRD